MITGLLRELTSQLNTASEADAFPMRFNAVRRAVPYANELSEVANAEAIVAPGRIEWTQQTRALVAGNMRAEIGVFQRLASEANADVDPLIDLAESITDWTRGRGLVDGVDAATWTGSQFTVITSPDHLYQMATYAGLIVVTYQRYKRAAP